MTEPCFHCGLPVPAGERHQAEVLGRSRDFCCAGCEAVCEAIVDSGLEDYYRHREGYSEPSGEVAVALLERLSLYDRPEIQKQFVQERDGLREAWLILEHIRCAACLWLNERHLRQLPGVDDVHIDYATQRAWVRWDPEQIRLAEILAAVQSIGYVAHPYDPSHRQELLKDEKRRSGQRLLFAGLAGMPVMQFALATYFMGSLEGVAESGFWEIIGRWTSLAAVLAILGYSGQDFFVGAWRDLRNRRLGMDVPVVLGLLTALAGSVVSTLRQSGEVYYDSIAMFVFFLLLARHIEMRGRRTAAAALDRMAQVTPVTAHRVGPEGSEEEVPVFDLQPGDRLRVRPGESVPVDGVLRRGSSEFDESLLTGEFVPVPRGEGSLVFGGSCNREQPVEIEVTQGAADSTPQRVRRLVDRGLAARPRYAVLAERAATWFVGIILVVASATALVWWNLDPAQALRNTVAVLIVTCPCALALATPVALALSAGRFTELGVLPLRMDAIEPLAAASAVALDKTGTLTRGTPHLEKVERLGDLTREQVLQMAVALERDSEHPLAHAFREALPASGVKVEAPRNFPGEGVEGRWQGETWRLGRPDFATFGQAVKGDWADRLVDWVNEGHLVQVLGTPTGPKALFGLRDRLRPGARELPRQLRQAGVERLVVLSGDRPDAVARQVGELGLDQSLGGLKPADKLAWIAAEQADGTRVMMVGDGINDAPTLAAADVSVSFQGASDLAQIHSDFVVLGQDLSVLAPARELARRTRNTIRQNLFWAAGYNLAAVPAAALGMIPPWGAALGMSASSLIVVGNAWRLYRATDPARRGWRQRLEALSRWSRKALPTS